MSLEQQKQQHDQQQQQQHLQQQTIITTPTLHNDTVEYANIAICSEGMLQQQQQQPTSMPPTSTFMTIGMLGPPPQQPSSMLTGLSPMGDGSTSSFKTTLLPMPSLEDIEGGIMLAPNAGTVVTTTMSQPQMLASHQQPKYPQPIPGGILKYPTPTSTTTNTIALGIPIDLGPGPGPPSSSSSSTTVLMGEPMTMLQPPPQPQHQPPASLAFMDVASCGGGTLKSNAIFSLATSMPPTQQGTVVLPSLAALNMQCSAINTPGSMLIGGGGGGTTIAAITTMATAMPTTSTATNNPATSNNRNNGSSSSSNNSSNGNGNGRQKAKTRCCACFGGNNNGNGGIGGRSHQSTNRIPSKRHKAKKTQTIWSALLTNLGICALLLAYTLLGSFIFLTIESEDSMLLQRTLASTKRGGSGSHSGRNSNVNMMNNNIYHSQQHQQHQQQQRQQYRQNQQHFDNATNAAASSSSSSSPFSSSGHSYSSLQSAAQASLSATDMLEGIVPLNNAFDNNYNNNNDFIYADDVANPQFALSADTYDVRQRTIENIWDITVSLNILYKENWTKLAALEIAKFQDQIIKRLNDDALLQLSNDIDGTSTMGDGSHGNSPATEAVLLHTHHYYHHGPYEWNFAKAFLYSLTVLTTIGYGNIAPRTTLGRLVTLAYAIFGIPLTLVYLSSTGGILAKVAREVFSKALCCCLCSNCGYCCYDEKRMAEKERRTKRKRQLEELRKQQSAMQEPYYVRSGSMTESSFQTPEKQPSTPTAAAVQLPPDIDSLSASESRGSMHGLSILAPILLCLSMMIVYIIFGALVLYRLENWPIVDGIYFCFMSLSTIGFGDMLPGMRRESTTTTWFCSVYIMSGMALTAMCFNVIHEEIVHRIKIVVEFKKANGGDAQSDEQHNAYYMAS